jgi:hypothetical protein
MAEAIPQLDSAADEMGDIGAEASVDAVSTDTSSGGPDGQPRAKTNPEEKFQAKYDKVVSQTGRLLSSPYLKTLGADGIIRALEQFEAVISHPEIKKSLETGALVQGVDGKWQYRAPAAAPTAKPADGSGDYEDPVIAQIESRMEAKYGQQIETLAKQVHSLRERNDSALSETSAQKVSDLTRRFLVNYPLSNEERAEFSEGIGERLTRLDPTVVLKMNDEQFEEYVGLPTAKKFLPAIFARKARQRGSQLADLATDANGTASLGADQAPTQPAKPVSRAKLNEMIAAAAMRAAREPA